MSEVPLQRRNDLGQPVGAALPDWRPAARPPRTPLVGRFCRLEPVDPTRHAAALFAACAADRAGAMWTYLPYGPFASAEAFADWLARTCLGDDPLFHAILEPRGDRALGLAAYMRIDPPVGVIEVGHLSYSPALQRSAAATEAMGLMMARAFDELGYRRYEWKCDSLNAPSRRAAERLGFTFEGLFRQATIYKGRNRDTAWYSILDREWPALKAAFAGWLDPGNFDAAGRQRRRLGELIAAERHPPG